MDPRVRKAGSTMTFSSRLRHARKAVLLLGASAALVTSALVSTGATPARAAGTGPCDIYGNAGTPCVAAHSTTRALYGTYNGPLYQVRRASDNTTTSIYPLSAGGVANAATQNSFCAGTTCVITEIYDQSGHGNYLTDAPGGAAARTASRTQPPHRSRSAATRPTASTLRPVPGTAMTAPPASRPAMGQKASTRSSTARTTTAAAASTTATPRPTTTTTAPGTWRPSTSATSRSGATAPATARGSWPTWRTACSPGPTRATTRTTRPPVTGSPPPWSKVSRTSGPSSAATRSPADCRPITVGCAPRVTTPCTRKGRSSSASAATTARVPPAPSTKAS